MTSTTAIFAAFVFAVSGFITTAHAQGTATASEMTAPQASSSTANSTATQNGEKILTGEEIRKLISGKKIYFDWKPSNTSMLRGRYDFFENGTFILYNAGTGSGPSVWYIEKNQTGDQLCREFAVFANKDKRCTVVSFKNNNYFMGRTPMILY